MTESSLPVGNIVTPIAHADVPQKTDYTGKFIDEPSARSFNSK